MSADVVNLRRARKAAARGARAASAAENRIRHGRSKAERTVLAHEAERAERLLDGARLGGQTGAPPPPSRDGG